VGRAGPVEVVSPGSIDLSTRLTFTRTVATRIGERTKGIVATDVDPLTLVVRIGEEEFELSLTRRLGPLSTRLIRGTELVTCLGRGELYESSAPLETEAWDALSPVDVPAIVQHRMPPRVPDAPRVRHVAAPGRLGVEPMTRR
jgi:hypothetical protein